MKEARFANLVNLLMNLVVGTTLGITGQIVMGSVSILGFLQSLVLSVAIGFFVGTWIPLNQIGKKCSVVLGVKGAGEYIISCVSMAVIMVTLICLGCSFVQAGTAFLFVFMKLYVPFIVVCIFTILIFMAPIGKFAGKILR